MERNKKNHSNHLSAVNLSRQNDQSLFPNIHSQQTLFLRDDSQKNKSSLTSLKQRNILPLENQYTYMNKYKKLDNFLDMQNYFNNLYGKKKQNRIQKEKSIIEQKQKQNRQKLVLPSIYQKQNQSFQQEMMKLKLQHLQERFNRMEPMKVIDCNRFPQIYQQNQCQCHMNNQCNNNNFRNDNPNSQNNNKPKRIFTKEQKKRLIRKFRVCAYAVYFAIFFPHYSLLFGHFKLKGFLQKYLIEGNKQIRSMNDKVIQKFKSIPLYEDIRVIHQEYEQKKLIQKSKNKQKQVKPQQQDPKIKISNQQSKQNYVINLNIFKKIVLHIIKTFDNIVDQFDDQFYQFFAVGALNTSYYGDQIYSLEEMPFLYCHAEKGNVVLNQQQQKAMLLSNFFIKRIIYQYLVRLSVDPVWHEELASFSTLKKKETTFFKLICKQLELCSFFLYQLSIKSFYTLIQSSESGNFLDQGDNSLPLPLRTMKFPSLFMSKSQKQLFNSGFQTITSNRFITQKKLKGVDNSNSNISKKSDSKQSISKFESKYNWSEEQDEIFEQYNALIEQDPLNLVHNNFQFGQLSKIIGQYMKSSYEKAEKSVIKIVTKLKDKVYEQRKKNYQKIHQKILKKKYILTQQHQILQGVVFLRNQQQKKQVAISRNMLQIYLQILGKHQIQARDHVTQLSSKRQVIKKKNNALISNKSLISVVSS